jgi:hypothetical protein
MRIALSSSYKMYNTQPYPPEVLALQTPEGFEQAFWNLYTSSEWKSRERCFELLSDEFEHLYGYRKYSEYNSFRVQMATRHRKRRKGM